MGGIIILTDISCPTVQFAMAVCTCDRSLPDCWSLLLYQSRFRPENRRLVHRTKARKTLAQSVSDRSRGSKQPSGNNNSSHFSPVLRCQFACWSECPRRLASVDTCPAGEE
mmetsp:Transcript_20464/g.44613  ORF Transcript_20464/g.44613 Transcript_20464/m.44613 type:complete len:111 (-) Transcript_20464:345-677(-)